MILANVFDATREGNWEAFQKFYNGSVNQLNPHTGYNLLQLAVTSTQNPEERLQIIRFLLEHGIDLAYKEPAQQRNVLHIAFFGFLRGDIEYLKKLTELLITAGADVNAADKFNAIPLKYAITISKHPTEDMKDIYAMLIRAGSDYTRKDTFQKSCLDYAQEYSWRNGFLDIVREIEADL